MVEEAMAAEVEVEEVETDQEVTMALTVAPGGADVIDPPAGTTNGTKQTYDNKRRPTKKEKEKEKEKEGRRTMCGTSLPRSRPLTLTSFMGGCGPSSPSNNSTQSVP